MTNILFYNEQHKAFYHQYTNGKTDPYFRALAYLFGLTAETRANFPRCFDMEEWTIAPEALNAGWQTGGTARIVRLAFNLWNSWCYETVEDMDARRVSDAFTPDNLFCCRFAPFFFEAIKLRYPEYTAYLPEVDHQRG